MNMIKMRNIKTFITLFYYIISGFFISFLFKLLYSFTFLLLCSQNKYKNSDRKQTEL